MHFCTFSEVRFPHTIFWSGPVFLYAFCTPALGWGALPSVSGRRSAEGDLRGVCGGVCGGFAGCSHGPSMDPQKQAFMDVFIEVQTNAPIEPKICYERPE